MSTIRKNSIYKPTNAKISTRIGAFILDIILFVVLFTGVLYLFSLIANTQQYIDILNEEYIRIGYKYFDEAKQEYVFISEEAANFKEVIELYNASEIIAENNAKLNVLVLNGPLISIVVCSLIFDLLIPLLLKNGQSIGMKVFNIGLLSKSEIAVTPMQVVLRCLLGKITVNKVVPYLALFLVMFAPTGAFFGLLVFLIIFIGNLVLLCSTKNHTGIADIIASVYPVDASQTVFYKTHEERQKAIDEENKLIKSQKKVY